MMRRARLIGTALAGALALAGCVNLAPDYARPAAPIAPAWPAGVATPGPAAAEVG